MNAIIDTTNGTESPICRVYRVCDGAARLFVGRDRKIWIGYGEEPERFSYVADLPEDEPITKANVRRAANC